MSDMSDFHTDYAERIFLSRAGGGGCRMESVEATDRKTMLQKLPPPKGITVSQAARMLQYSVATIRRMIEDGELVAWKPRAGRGRRWLIDEVSLALIQRAQIDRARRENVPLQQVMKQGVFSFTA